MKQFLKVSAVLSTALLLAACGSDDETSSTETLVRSSEVTSGDQTYNSVVGIDGSETYAYFDLDTGLQLDLNEETAATNTEWDVAFYSTNIIVNGGVSGPGSVEAMYTGNNSDFRNDSGAADVDKFMNATPESELPDFLAVTEYAADTSFSTDEFLSVFGDDFYIYGVSGHGTIGANDQQFYLVKSGDVYYKVRVTEASLNGFSIGDFTLGIQELENVVVTTTGEGEETETTVTYDLQAEQLVALTSCDGESYIDLSSYSEVTSSDEWDLKVACGDIEVHLAAGVIAGDFDNADNAIAYAGTPYEAYYAGPDSSSTVFKDQSKWYEYNLDGQNQIWSQYGVYLVKTADATYKFQVTGYYNLVDGELKSRQHSFIYAEVEAAAPVVD